LLVSEQPRCVRILAGQSGQAAPRGHWWKIHSFNILQRLARDHEVAPLWDHGGAADSAYSENIANEFSGAQTIAIEEKRSATKCAR